MSDPGLLDPSESSDESDSEGSEKFYGKYRGVVINNVDPMQMGRINALVPDVSTVLPTTWAMPCVPIAGIQMGLFAMPTIGSGVWIEFENGDPDYPIWTGCFWGSPAEVPLMSRLVPPAIPGITFQTPLQNGIMISDLPGPAGGILLKIATLASIMINDTGITIQNGKGAAITMNGPMITIAAPTINITGLVSINKTNLVVLP
jgi:hypothetical protein